MSAERGGKKIPQIYGQTSHTFCGQGAKKSKLFVDASAPPYMEAPGDERTETTNVKERNGGKKKLTHRSHRVEGSKNGHIPLCFHLALISLFPLSDT